MTQEVCPCLLSQAFGKGVYFADMLEKSLGYCHPFAARNRWGHEAPK